ncbi:MAG: hypothetical protein O3C10_12145 [Chloroflexi bacterium]|nr:hypothetical protein [Chloroflexota bacterium]
MSLTAFLVGNALLALILVAWNLFVMAVVRAEKPRWTAAIGIQWRFGAATAALIAVAVALIDAILFGEDDQISEVAAIYSLGALSVAVTHAVLSLLFTTELIGRGLDFTSSSFSEDSPWRRPIEWATVVLVPLGLIAALIAGVVTYALA